MNRMDPGRQAGIISALVEGVGIRSTCRMTGASKGADAETKLIPPFMVGPRDGGTATEFMQDLAGRLACRPQITTDGLNVCLGAVEDAFAGEVDYAQLVKIYGATVESEHRYSLPVHERFVYVPERLVRVSEGLRPELLERVPPLLQPGEGARV